MYELGKKSEIFGTDLLKPLNLYGRPTSMPTLVGNEMVICGYDQGLGERMIVCENMQDMQELYDGYARGGALNIHWYTSDDPGFISIVPSQPDEKPDEGQRW